MVSNAVWLEKRIRYIESLKSLTDNQQVLMELAGKAKRTALEERQFKSALKLEKLAEATAKAKAESAMLKNSAKKVARKARDHELYNCAGLMIMAELVDSNTGLPVRDRAELLGALMGLAQVPDDDPRRADWQRVGEEKLKQAAASSAKTKRPAPSTEPA